MANNCPNCGHEINTDLSYDCSKCGAEFWQSREIFKKHLKSIDSLILKKNISTKPEDEESTPSELRGSGLMIFFEIATMIYISIMGMFYGFAVFIILIPALTGSCLAYWYSKKVIKENDLTKSIAWINIVSWLSPTVGVFTSLASIQFNAVYGKKDKKYIILGTISFVLSLINWAINTWIRFR